MMNRGGSSTTMGAWYGGGALPMFRLIPKFTSEANAVEATAPKARMKIIIFHFMTFDSSPYELAVIAL